MPTRSMTDSQRVLQEQAAYWLAHATSLAQRYAHAPGLTAMIGRQRARQAFRFYGECIATLETSRAGLRL